MRLFRFYILIYLLLILISNIGFLNEKNNIQITAHRGDSLNYDENTLSAFKSAKEIGADWIELDVHHVRATLKVEHILIQAHRGLKGKACGKYADVWCAAHPLSAEHEGDNRFGKYGKKPEGRHEHGQRQQHEPPVCAAKRGVVVLQSGEQRIVYVRHRLRHYLRRQRRPRLRAGIYAYRRGTESPAYDERIDMVVDRIDE